MRPVPTPRPPPLSEPVMVVALEGWIDAGMAGATAMSSILADNESSLVASFDTDSLLDHRARRPVMSLAEGHVERLTWPTIELRATLDDNGRHVLLLAGAEPDHLWGHFSSAVIELAAGFETNAVIGLGAYPTPVPHTRDHAPRPDEPLGGRHGGVPRLLQGHRRGAGGHPSGHRDRRGHRRDHRDGTVGAGAPLHLGDALPGRRDRSARRHYAGGGDRLRCRRTGRRGRGDARSSRRVDRGQRTTPGDGAPARTARRLRDAHGQRTRPPADRR